MSTASTRSIADVLTKQEAELLADAVAIMSKGQIVAMGSPDELIERNANYLVLTLKFLDEHACELVQKMGYTPVQQDNNHKHIKVRVEHPWPLLLLAETRTAQGNKKQAIKDLREAIRRGLKSAETIEKDSNLRALSSDHEFQKILRELHATGK